MKHKLNRNLNNCNKNNNNSNQFLNRQKGNKDLKRSRNGIRLKKSDFNKIQLNERILKELPKMKRQSNVNNFGIFAKGLVSNTFTINQIRNNNNNNINNNNNNNNNNINNNNFNNHLSQQSITNQLRTNSFQNYPQNCDHKRFKTENNLNYRQNWFDSSVGPLLKCFSNHSNEKQINEINYKQNSFTNCEQNFVNKIYEGLEVEEESSRSSLSDYGFHIFNESNHKLSPNSVQTYESLVNSEQTLVEIESNNGSENERKKSLNKYSLTNEIIAQNVINNYSNERKEFAKRISVFGLDLLSITCQKLRSIALSRGSPLNKEWIECVIKLRQENQ
jgi:hypothetical protein